jgi:hypothetical protein
MLRNRADELAHVDRAGSRVYGEARAKQYAFARKNWRWLAGMALVGLAPNGLSFFYGSSFLQGLGLGLTVAGTLALLSWLVVMYSGTAPAILGAGAERWTAEEVDELRRHGFEIVHHGALRPGDIDHVLIGPAGVLVLETKWRSGAWIELGLSAAKRQAEANANALRLVTKRFGVRRVVPVVVAWGPQSRELPAPPLGWVPAEDSAVVLHGSELRRWILSLAGGALTTEQVKLVRTEIAAHAERRDKTEKPLPIPVWDAVMAIWRPVVATYAGLLTAFPITWLPWPGQIAVVLGGLWLALALRRLPGWRVAGTASATVEAGWLALIIIDLLV